MSLTRCSLNAALALTASLCALAAPASWAGPCAPLLVDAAGDAGAFPAQALPPQEPAGLGDLVGVELRSTDRVVEVVVRLADAAASPYDHSWVVTFGAHEQRWAASARQPGGQGTGSVFLSRASAGTGGAQGPGAASYDVVGTGTGGLDVAHDRVVMRFDSRLFGPSGVGRAVLDPLAVTSLAQPGSAIASAVFVELDDARAEGVFRTSC